MAESVERSRSELSPYVDFERAQWSALRASTPLTLTEADVESLREAGWSDEDIMDMTETAAMFNFTNRLANSLGWTPNPEYESLGR